MSRPDADFLQVEFYYPVVDSDAGLDTCGDAVIAGMLVPLMARLRTESLVSHYEFMRYSVGGYHIRVKLRGERSRLEQARDGLVVPFLEGYRREHAALLGHDMALGDFSRRLYQRLAMDPEELFAGGEFTVAFARDHDGLYEDARVFDAYVRFSEQLCDTMISALDQLGDVRSRKIFVRLLLADLLATSGLEDNELFYVLVFIQRQWELYFAMDAAQVGQSRATAAALAPAFHAFLARRSGISGSAAALPEAARALYVRSATALSEAMPTLVRREPHGGIGNNTALRLLSLVHLTHNRMGLDIMQEVLFTGLLTGFHEMRIGQEEADDSRRWVETNLAQYMSRNEQIVY